MTTIPTVYYGGVELSHSAIHTPVENLFKHLKKSSPMRDDRYYKCPAFIDWAKEKLVMKSHADIEVSGEIGKYIQWFEGEFYFFADSEVKMTYYPPFLDFTNIRGVLGEMDISKWFRAIHPVSVMDETGKLKVAQDQAVLYIGFDRKVNLQRVIFPKDLERIAQTIQTYKLFETKGRTLNKLYSNFMRAKCNRVVLKRIKDFNGL